MPTHPRTVARLALPWLAAASLVAGCASTGADPAGSAGSVAAEATVPPAEAGTAGAETTAPPETAVARDGSSCETAIVIEAETTREGVDAEYRWLAEHFPGYRTEEQSLIRCGENEMADLIEIRTADGRSIGIFFDITSFFGKR